MSIVKKNILRISRKKHRVRYKLKRTSNGRLRIAVFRSLKHIYAQIIDDKAQHTIASCSSMELKEKGANKEGAFNTGKELARRLLALNISYKDQVVFDRGRYEYHGRVAEVAAGLRDGGLIF